MKYKIVENYKDVFNVFGWQRPDYNLLIKEWVYMKTCNSKQAAISYIDEHHSNNTRHRTTYIELGE